MPEVHRRRVIFAKPDYDALIAALLRPCDNSEHFVFLLAGLAVSDTETAWIVRDLIVAGADDYERQTPSFIELRPEFVFAALHRAQRERLHLIECHSHPFHHGPGVRFSELDVAAEREKFPWLVDACEWMRPSTLVFGHDSVDGHTWLERKIRPLHEISVRGMDFVSSFTTSGSGNRPHHRAIDVHDRQVRAIGVEAQTKVAKLRVGVVGCGGLGSVLCQQLAHLGVSDFVLVDGDKVETTNLNRLALCVRSDVGRSKVDCIAERLRLINLDAHVCAMPLAIEHPEAAKAISQADVVFSCVDEDSARLEVCKLCVRYLIPHFDLGSGIKVDAGQIRAMGGQVFAIPPAQGCLFCHGGIAPDALRISAMNELERNRHLSRGYGTGEPQPAVMPLNSVVASLAAQDFLLAVGGIRQPGGVTLFDGLAGTVSAAALGSKDPECSICSLPGAFGRGDLPETRARAIRKAPVGGNHVDR